MALVSTLVLVPMVFMAIDLATLAYVRVKLKNTADAVAMAAVAESSSWHIPIPTEWVGWFPVNGWLLNGLHLKNLSVQGKANEKLAELARKNQDQMGLALHGVTVERAGVSPLGNWFSPVMYVRIPVAADVKLHTPYARTFSKNGTIRLRAESCAVAWYRPDRWLMKWWTPDKASFVETLDNFINVEGEPLKHYRLVNCLEGAADWVSLAEIGVTAYRDLDRESKDLLDQWSTGRSQSKTLKKARDQFRTGPPDDCKTVCVDGDKGSIDEWADTERDRRKAEEEAEKAREEAARKAQEAQQEAGQQR